MITLLAIVLFGGQIDWQDYDEIKDGKPTLIFFTADWCHYCQVMKKTTFTNKRVIAESKRFTCFMVDADSRPDLIKDYKIKGLPTIILLDKNKKEVARLVGKKTARQLIKQLEKQ